MAILDIINKNISKLSTPILTPEEREAPFGDLVSRVKNNITKLGGAQQTPLTMTPEEVSKRITGGIDRLKGTKTIFKTAQEIGQEITKSGGSVGLTLTGKDKLEIDSSSSQWQQKIQETIFGKEPVKSLQTRIAEGELKIQPFLRKRGLEKAALPISFLGVGLITGIDFTGLGGSKNAIKLLSKSKDIPFITKTLKQIGVADDIILPAAQKIATITDEKEIKLAIDKISELQKTTKVAPGIKSTTQATKAEPLAQEARKYKTAEEFANKSDYVYQGIGKGKQSDFLTTNINEANAYATQRGLKGTGEIRVYKFNDLPNYIKTITKESENYDVVLRELGKDFVNKPLTKQQFSQVQTAIGFSEKEIAKLPLVAKIKNQQQLTDIYTQATKGVEKVADVGKTERGFISSAKKIVPKITPRERGFITSVKETVPQLGTRVAGRYIPRSTDKLAMKAKALVEQDFKLAEKLIREETTDASVATAAEYIKRHNELANKTTSELAKSAHYDQAAKIANDIAIRLTEQGRSIQAASILGRLTPEGQLRFAARTIQKFNEGVKPSRKIPQLTKNQTKDILNEATKVHKMPDGVGKAMANKKLNEKIANLVPTPLYKKIINVWKAGLLTGIKTTGLNVLSNAFHGVSEIAKDIPAVAVDKVASLLSGKRTIGLTLKQSPQGIKEGFEKGLRYWKTGFDERDIAKKLDWRRVSFGDSKFARVAQAYEQSVFRALGAQDQPFYYGAKARSIASQAIAQGKNNKLKGKNLRNFVNRMIENPSDDILSAANLDAEIAVFQNQTVLGAIARGIQKFPGGLGEVVVPFGRTPAAVATQMFNYSPVGIASTIIKAIGKGKFDQKAFAQGIGRGLTGTAVMAIGAELLKKGLITLGFPTSEKEREQWKLEGKKPNSIKIGDKWRSIAVLGPAGFVLLSGGYYENGVEDTGTIWGGLGEATFGGFKSLKDQTFLQGINQVMGALEDPKRFSSYLNRTFSSIVPTIVSDIARTKDVVERRIEGPLESLFSRLPVLRQMLAPQVDVLGQEVIRGGNFMETMIDPSRPKKIKSTPVVDEMKRLWDLGHRVTPTQLGDKKGFKSLTQEQNTKLWKFTGTILENKLANLFGSKEYKELTDTEKEKVIGKFVEKSRLFSRVAMVNEVTKDLQGKELKDRLTQLKADGLLTKTVFNEYIKLR